MSHNVSSRPVSQEWPANLFIATSHLLDLILTSGIKSWYQVSLYMFLQHESSPTFSSDGISWVLKQSYIPIGWMMLIAVGWMTDNDNVTLDPDPLSKYTAAEAALQSAADTAASAVPVWPLARLRHWLSLHPGPASVCVRHSHRSHPRPRPQLCHTHPPETHGDHDKEDS